MVFNLLSFSWGTVGAAVLVAYAAFFSLKGLPGTWSLRMLGVAKHHLLLNRTRTVTAKEYGPRVLFQPIITTSHSSIFEIDWYMHKSNSTYFSDLDISRTHLLSTLFKKVMRVHGGTVDPMIGAVLCVFRRAIHPNQRYEIWSRVLCWDDKWLYIVSHFVKLGTSKSTHYALKNSIGARHGTLKEGANAQNDIFATALTKYVFKNGRVTMSPEQALDITKLLPDRPILGESSSTPVTERESAGENPVSELEEKLLDQSITAELDGNEEWDWQRVETERRRGYQISHLLGEFDKLHETFPEKKGRALNKFSDW